MTAPYLDYYVMVTPSYMIRAGLADGCIQPRREGDDPRIKGWFEGAAVVPPHPMFEGKSK